MPSVQLVFTQILSIGSISATAQTPESTQTAEDKKVFARLDISENGYLTGTEIKDEIRGYDTNNDRVISWEEFAAGRARDRTAGKKTALPPSDDDPAPSTTKTVKAVKPSAATAPRSANRSIGAGNTEPRPAAVRLTALKARPGYVIGRAVYADGRPLPRFRVTALGWSGEIHLGATGTLPSLGSVLAENGRYAIQTTSEYDRRKPVKATVTSVQANAIFLRNGQEYTIGLYPTDGKKEGSGEGHFRGDSGRGVVRDFVLRLYGPRPGYETSTPPRDTNTNERSDPSFGAFHGGTVSVHMPNDAFQTMDNAIVTASFTPTSPLFDGSPAKALVRRVALRKPNVYTAHFRDIPLGDYTVTVSVTQQDGTIPLRIRLLGKDLGSSAPVIFSPFYSYGVSDVALYTER